MDIDKTVGDSGGSGGAVAGTLSSSRSIKMRRKFYYVSLLSFFVHLLTNTPHYFLSYYIHSTCNYWYIRSSYTCCNRRVGIT